MAIAMMIPLLKPCPGMIHIVTGANGAGKTRYLSSLADAEIDRIKSGESSYSKVVCLSGPVVDKYSQRVYRQTLDFEYFTYLGYRRNNNLFSETAPFREILLILMRSAFESDRMKLMALTLETINLDPVITIILPEDKGLKRRTAELDFLRGEVPRFPPEISTARAQFECKRAGNTILLQSLSGGERAYLLLMLAFCFCLPVNSLVLLDEPEASLHPEWQLTAMNRLLQMANKLQLGLTIVIATHSPLVVASVPNETALICELPSSERWTKKDLFGQTADTVLAEQFGVVSPRSPDVLQALQNCLTLIASGQGNSPELRRAIDYLNSFELNLAESDPLYETLATIRKFGRDKN